MVKLSDVLDKKGRNLKEADLGEQGRREPAVDPPPAPKPGDKAAPAAAKPPAAQAPAQPARSTPPSSPQPSDDAHVMPPEETPLDAEEMARLVSYYTPNSPEAKRIDMLRSQLLYPFHGEPPRTIMITSAAPGEGRSLLTANLAISFARGLQQYVMVIDCHLSDPVQHRLLGVPRVPGLTDFLLYDTSLPDIMHWSKVDKLSVIPAGSPSNRSSEILATDKMLGMIRELRSRYKDRYILLDTPPVQAFDDPAVLARMVEGIVVLVLGGVTDRELVLRSIHSLPEEKIVGLVLNDMNSAVMDAPALGTMQGEGN
ncbi:MAG: hypothetical protein K9K66_13695 [Desulfarculaceae bacterium]|nr:hypothetical protein [Desulfarculaceae bacterium]MCF8074018.1 hypothetical protein [Desulfarculaceae bacterium]MCF8102704.1 hypothetical protein [Desulfarculaceae bacterium]MCF8116055.1 hypothetical protein [Desulfarculaceae bacterium]